jgi:hypothetical protein
MKTKFISLILLLLSGMAIAHDMTYSGPIKRNESVSVKLELPQGELVIDVASSDQNTKFNCDFGFAWGEVVLEQHGVSKCYGNFNVAAYSHMLMKITNLSGDSNYKIWVRNRR